MKTDRLSSGSPTSRPSADPTPNPPTIPTPNLVDPAASPPRNPAADPGETTSNPSTLPTPSPQATRNPYLGALAAEWVKFRTLTSNRVLLVLALIWIPASALLASVSLGQRAADPDPTRRIAAVDPYTFLDTVLWVQLLIAVMAALCAAGEYSGGRLRITFLATPTRVPVALAKAGIMAAVSFVVGLLGATAGMLLPVAVLRGVAYEVSAGQVAGLAAASGAYLAGIALVALGLGVAIRNVVGSVLASLALLTIVPAVLASTGNDAVTTLSGLMPTIAGRVVISTFDSPAGLGAGAGSGTLAAWAALAVAGAALAYRLRDA